MSTLPSPVAQWDEPPSSGAAGTLTRMLPYKLATGYWVFLPLGTAPPVGATLGAVVRTSGILTFLTSTTVGLRITRNPAGLLFFY